MANDPLKALVKNTLAPPLKALGFRKSGLRWWRRTDALTTCVELQKSASPPGTWRFYVNVGFAFDEVCRRVGAPVLERPKPHELDVRGERWRLESLVPDADERWELSTGTNADTITRIAACWKRLAEALAEIDSLDAFCAHAWFDHAAHQLRAQCFCERGELDAAEVEVRALEAAFADRSVVMDREYWIDRLGLHELA